MEIVQFDTDDVIATSDIIPDPPEECVGPEGFIV